MTILVSYGSVNKHLYILKHHITAADFNYLGFLLRQVLRELSAVHVKLDAHKVLLDSLYIQRNIVEQQAFDCGSFQLPASSVKDLLEL